MFGRQIPGMLSGSVVLALVVGACTADEGATGPWKTNPRGAREVSDAELEALRAAGTLTPVMPDKWRNDSDRRAAEAAEDQAVIDQLLTAHPELARRLKPPAPRAGVTVLADGNHEIKIDTGGKADVPIELHGARVRNHTIVQAYRRFNTHENQVGIYRAMFPLLSDACVAGRPAPEAIGSLTVDELKTHTRAMAACLLGASSEQGSANPAPPAGRVEARAQYKGAAPPAADGAAYDSGGGVGIDSSNCNHLAGGIYEKAVWSGKWFDTSVKWQGRRGSCVSFAIAGALEQGISRETNEWVDLAEQALYANAKVNWSPDDLEDGLSLPGTVGDMVDKSYAVPFETSWPYNTSKNRLPCNGDKTDHDCSKDYDDPDYYTHSCDDYSYTCGETTHQASLVCHKGDCYYHVPVTASAGAYRIATSLELNDIEDPQSALLARAFIDLGFGLAIGMDAYQSFVDVGVNGTYQGQKDDDDFKGGHAMHASGVIFDSQVPQGIPHPSGGGYVVLKNSWGCSGDGGYYYLSFDAADHLMDSAVAILPSKPLQNIAPKIQILQPSSGTTIPLSAIESQTHLVASVSDYEDGAGCCGVSWFLGDTFIGHGAALDATLPTASLCAGNQTLAAVATDSRGKTSRAEATLSFTAKAIQPTIDTPTSGQTLYRGATYIFDAKGVDGKGAPIPCDKITWTSDDPTALKNVVGCQVPVVFGTNGDRSILISMSQACGGSYQSYRLVHVVDPPTTDPPVVTITNPNGTELAPAAVANPSAQLNLTASVLSPGSHPLTFSWGARDAGTTSAFTPLANTKNYTWSQPSQLFPFHCGGRTLEIRLCATDVNGTTCKSTFARLIYPTC